MVNQTKDKEQSKKNSVAKPQSKQPTYEDKPWQAPEYGQKQNKSQKDSDKDSCGCGS